MLKKCLVFLFLIYSVNAGAKNVKPHPHPFFCTPDKISTAKKNIEMHTWAKDIADEILKSADDAASRSDENLRSWFSEYTPISQCDCPYCGHNCLDYVWEWTPDKPDQVTCRYCNGITSLTHFPENDAVNIIDPQGVIHPHPVYKDSTGKIFPIQQLLYFHKNKLAYQWINDLGAAYALTREERYAEKAIVLLRRLAEVYAGFGIHDNFRFEPYPFGWAGKLRMWHYTDAYTLQACAETYDAIYNSRTITDSDKEIIENRVFRIGLNFLTAVAPSQGISNDMPYRYAGVAMLARTLEDHAGIHWVMEPEEGFEAFINKLFYKDGTWHERAPGYHNMVARSLHETIEILEGYSDPVEYDGPDRYDQITLKHIRKLGNIHSILLDMRLPDGTLPPVNDGQMGSKPIGIPLEALYKWTGDIKWLHKANQAHEGKFLQTGSRYALFNRDPMIADKFKEIPSAVMIPDGSRDFTGMGLFVLRRGSGKDQTVFTMHHHKYSSAHTHYDALSTILFANGREMLSDFGYPSFSSPLRMNWYLKSLSHNTLSVDTNNQAAPNGVANWLHHGEIFSACEAEAWEAYRFICEPFFRQIALVDIGDAGIYAVDIFRGDGGKVHDWALHGEGDSLVVRDVTMHAVDELAGNEYAYKMLENVHMGRTSENWRAQWLCEDGISLRCHFPGMDACEIYNALTPGERLKSMKGRKKNSLFNRRRGDQVRSEFVGIYEPTTGDRLVRSVEKLYVSPERDWTVVLKITLDDEAHYILTSYLDLSPQGEPFIDGAISIDWKSRFGIVRVKSGRIVAQEWVKGVMEGLRHDM